MCALGQQVNVTHLPYIESSAKYFPMPRILNNNKRKTLSIFTVQDHKPVLTLAAIFSLTNVLVNIMDLSAL